MLLVIEAANDADPLVWCPFSRVKLPQFPNTSAAQAVAPSSVDSFHKQI
jgi:hypothetical protein